MMMKKVIVSTKENLNYGSLLWIYASNNKVYHSSQRVKSDTAFSAYDSNYMGKVEGLYKDREKQPALFKRMLSKSDRIIGVCLNKRRGEDGMKDVKVLFFSNWEDVQDFAENDFPELVEKERNRRKAAKQQWLERGKRFANKKKTM